MPFGAVSGVSQVMGILDGGGCHRRGRGSFGGKCGASHCNQWGLCGVVIFRREGWRCGSSQIPFLLLQEPWEQRPLVSIACLVISFHLLRSWAKLFSSYSPVLHQLTMSPIHSLRGLPLLFVPSTIPNISVFNFLWYFLLFCRCCYQFVVAGGKVCHPRLPCYLYSRRSYGVCVAPVVVLWHPASSSGPVTALR